MQRKQELSLNDIQLKLNKIKEVNYHLKATNEFMPNLSLLNQNETSTLFGSIRLNQYSNTNSFKGEILTDFKRLIYLDYVNFHQLTNGLCCIVAQEMALVQMTFIQDAMVIPIR